MTEILSHVPQSPLPALLVTNGRQKSMVFDENHESTKMVDEISYRIEQISDKDRSKIELTPQKSSSNDDSSANRKNCEAFLMTGDKMIRLTPKISPNFAKIKQQELSEHVQICSDLPLVCKQSSYEIEENFTTDKKVVGNGKKRSLERNLSAETPFCDSEPKNLPRPDTPIYCSAPASPSSSRMAVTAKNFDFTSSDDKSLDINPDSEPKNKDIDFKAAEMLAKRLYNLDGFKANDVSEYISKDTPFGRAILQAYVENFSFDGLKLDEALRKFLCKFCLTGETSKRERLISKFADRYFSCNPDVFRSSDEVHVLTCALLLLNVDLHNENVKKRMKFSDFVGNLSHSNYKFPKPLLKSLYCSIQKQQLKDAFDQCSNSTPRFETKFRHTVNFDTKATISGWLLKKSIFEENGKATPLGRRFWRNYHVSLRASILYLQKDNQLFRQLSYLSPQNSIPIFHAFASKADDYTKKMNVFRLRTLTQAEYLFQCSSHDEMQSWISEVNFAAAVYSAPCLPAPIGSSGPSESIWSGTMINTSLNRHYSLPKYRTKYNYDQQIAAYCNRLEELRGELESYHRNLPNRTTASGKILKLYAENEIFILNEIERYESYVDLLKKRSTVARDLFEKFNSKYPPDNRILYGKPILNSVIMENCKLNSKSQNQDHLEEQNECEVLDESSKMMNGHRRPSYDSAVGHSNR